MRHLSSGSVRERLAGATPGWRIVEIRAQDLKDPDELIRRVRGGR